ncbi:MAG: SGNH/GDSL hydrolase family protein, partial [Candidatus Hydrogenedentales bacterium]
MKSTKTWHVPALVVLAIALSSPVWAGEAASAPDADITARSVVSMGNKARLQRVFAKAQRGEKVTVGVLGGSITQGALASSEDNRYGNRIAQWWRDTFPNAEIAFVNAGIGATGSDSGAHRVREHLLSKQPDFVVVEYAVNDPNVPAVAETLEGVVRQILNARNHPAVMLLFMMNEAGANSQEQHAPIGAHYELPMVSFRDALWPEIQAKRMAWSDVEADGVHPNDRGHEYAARFVTHVLQQTLET